MTTINVLGGKADLLYLPCPPGGLSYLIRRTVTQKTTCLIIGKPKRLPLYTHQLPQVRGAQANPMATLKPPRSHPAFWDPATPRPRWGRPPARTGRGKGPHLNLWPLWDLVEFRLRWKKLQWKQSIIQLLWSKLQILEWSVYVAGWIRQKQVFFKGGLILECIFTLVSSSKKVCEITNVNFSI